MTGDAAERTAETLTVMRWIRKHATAAMVTDPVVAMELARLAIRLGHLMSVPDHRDPVAADAMLTDPILDREEKPPVTRRWTYAGAELTEEESR